MSSRTRRIPFGERLIFLAFILVVLAVTLFPFFWMVSTSFKSKAEILAIHQTLLPIEWTWDNYRKLIEIFDLPRYLFNSLVFASGATALSLVFNGLAAYAFSFLQFPGREKLFTLLMLSMMVPMQITLLPLFLTLKFLGLLNSAAGLILPGSASVLGIFLMRQFMRDLPQEVIDQARMDGCSELDLFWRVVLPLCKPIVASLAVFTFVQAWNDFLGPLVVMLRDNGYPLPVALATLTSEHGGEWGLLMAGAVLSVIPSLAIFLLAQRHYMQGITKGAVR